MAGGKRAVRLASPTATRDAFAARLKTIVDQQESAEAFAERVGVSASALRKWLKGLAEPSRERLIALAETGGVSVEWLATGVEPTTVVAGKEEFVSSPFSYADQITDSVKLGDDWIRRDLGLNPDRLLLIRTMDEMQELSLHEGDFVLVDTGDTRIRNNVVYLLEINGDLLVRRIRKRLDGGLRAICGGESDSEEEIPPDAVSSLRIVGRVVWIGRRL